MNCYESNRVVQPYDLLIAETSEFGLTEGKVYVSQSVGYGELIQVANDKGHVEEYTTEHFRFYEGQTIW